MLSTRRQILKLGTAAGVLALLPIGRRLLANAPTQEPAAVLAYWRGGSGLADFSAVHAGWAEPCPYSAKQCGVPLHGELMKANHVVGSAGSYRLRIVGAELDEAMGLDAHYGAVHHMLWRSWRQDDGICHSGAIAVHWSARRGEALPLSLTVADAASARVDVPAQAGVYVLLPNAAEVDWAALQLHAPDAARPLDLRLRAASGRRPQYLLLTVDRLADDAAV